MGKSMRDIKIIVLFILLSIVGCSTKDSKDESEEDQDNIWIYFDREVYFPTGVSVTPNQSAAHQKARDALLELELETDLGKDFFIFKTDDDSLLQPISESTEVDGREWTSFIQIWDDDLMNEFLAKNLSVVGDDNAIVALNSGNKREFFIVLRLSCFLAGDTCDLATENQAKALVWRAMGYLIGMRIGDEVSSDIMRQEISPTQEDSEQIRRFMAEFNGTLERVRNGIPVPGDNPEDGEIIP